MSFDTIKVNQLLKTQTPVVYLLYTLIIKIIITNYLYSKFYSIYFYMFHVKTYKSKLK
jgi:hypothetical protein